MKRSAFRYGDCVVTGPDLESWAKPRREMSRRALIVVAVVGWTVAVLGWILVGVLV